MSNIRRLRVALGVLKRINQYLNISTIFFYFFFGYIRCLAVVRELSDGLMVRTKHPYVATPDTSDPSTPIIAIAPRHHLLSFSLEA